MNRCTVAAVQATPVFLDRDATVEKACRLTADAAAAGANIVVFPETFVPTYPDWVWRARPWHDAALFARLADQSVVVPSPATEMLAAAARDAGVYLAIGVNERAEHGSTLFNTLLTFAPDGALIGRHRKLMPTGGERLVWGMGDGSTLQVHDTPHGRLGGLICWENYMPLARAALYSQGVEIWLAPTWDNSDTWIATLRHIAKEGRMYVVGVAPCLRGSDVPASVPGRDDLWGGDDDWMSEGHTTIVDPDGTIIAGPLVREEGIVTAEIDIARVRAERRKFDASGHYARPDVFRLTVDARPKQPVILSDE